MQSLILNKCMKLWITVSIIHVDSLREYCAA